MDKPTITMTTKSGYELTSALPAELERPLDEWQPGDWLYKSMGESGRWWVSKLAGYEVSAGRKWWIVFVGGKLKPYIHTDMSEWRVFAGEGLHADEVDVVVKRDLKAAWVHHMEEEGPDTLADGTTTGHLGSSFAVWRDSKAGKKVEREARKRYADYKQRTRRSRQAG